MENLSINQFLDWLSGQDLRNIHNHGEEEDEAEVEDLEEVEEVAAEMEDTADDDGVQGDSVDMVGATLKKCLNVGASAVYCTTVGFTKVPTEEGDYQLCQLCYWRYMGRCHPLTNHVQETIHKTTAVRSIPRLYCGACECNLFVITNIATCTQCNHVNKM